MAADHQIGQWIDCHKEDLTTNRSFLRRSGLTPDNHDGHKGELLKSLSFLSGDPIDDDRLSSPHLLIVMDPEVVISSYAVTAMIDALDKGRAVIFPVYNETETLHYAQLAVMPCPYVNVSTYVEVSDILSRGRCKMIDIDAGNIDALDGACMMINRRYFHGGAWVEVVAEFSSFFQKNGGGSISKRIPLAICPNALVHRFGTYYAGESLVMVEKVPNTAQKVMDVGTARGGFGKALKQVRPDIHLSGVEPNRVMADDAGPYYDGFYPMPVEEVMAAHKLSEFDHVNCGEVVEHLYDPWQLMDWVYGILKPGGTLCISVPNAGHWSVVKELMAGQFYYIAIGLQCVGHIRWFTEASVRQLLEGAGFHIRNIERLEIPPTPQGDLFIQQMCGLGYGDRQDLMTFDMVIEAEKSE